MLSLYYTWVVIITILPWRSASSTRKEETFAGEMEYAVEFKR